MGGLLTSLQNITSAIVVFHVQIRNCWIKSHLIFSDKNHYPRFIRTLKNSTNNFDKNWSRRRVTKISLVARELQSVAGRSARERRGLSLHRLFVPVAAVKFLSAGIMTADAWLPPPRTALQHYQHWTTPAICHLQTLTPWPDECLLGLGNDLYKKKHTKGWKKNISYISVTGHAVGEILSCLMQPKNICMLKENFSIN